MNRLKYTTIVVVVAVVVIWGYYGFPVAHKRYLDQQQPQILSWLVMTTTWSTGNSIHDTTTTGYQLLIAEELPKLTKQTRVLLDQYNEDQDAKYLFDLVASLTDDGAYYTAIYLYQILLKEFPTQAQYPEYLTLLLNRGEYTPQFLVEYQHTVDTLATSGLITDQDQLFFTSFRTLISGDVDAFYNIVHQLSGSYAPIAGDLISNLTTYSQYKQAPRQYLWWLFASTLLRYGYYAPAIHLAQQSLKFTPDYVLGLQIMAYGHLMMHDRDISKSYLTQLMSIDASHLLTYQRLYGVASYWDNEYKDAIWYLTQVNDKIPNIELVRYIGLSYRSLYDYLHVTKTYRTILESQKSEAIDYFEFFDTYRRAVSYTTGMMMTGVINPIDEYDNFLLADYNTRCGITLTGELSYICDYGSALLMLFNGDVEGSVAIMTTIARNHPYDFVYGMIGDIYVIKNQVPTAQTYYQKAIESSYNGGYQRYLSNKIKTLTVNGTETN